MRPIILDNSKSLTDIVNDHTNGLGRPDWISAEVHQASNGEYEAILTMSSDDPYYAFIHVGTYLRMRTDAQTPSQIFQIYEINANIGKIVTIRAEHIFYKMKKTIVKPFNVKGITNSINALKNNIIATYPYQLTTTLTGDTTTEFGFDVPMTFMEMLIGDEYSFVNTFGGEVQFDNLSINVLKRRGIDDTNITIRYGKDLLSMDYTENNANVYDGIFGYIYTRDQRDREVEKYIYVLSDAQWIGNEAVSNGPRLAVVDLTSEFEYAKTRTVNGKEETYYEYPSKTDLNTYLSKYKGLYISGVPETNLEINFITLPDDDFWVETKPKLHALGMGDKITVVYPELGIHVDTRIIEYTYDVLAEKYISMTIGNPKINVEDAIRKTYVRSYYKKKQPV